MPADYVPRRYMIRGVITTGIIGTYYEIIRPGSDSVVEWDSDYLKLRDLCDILNDRYKNSH